jgi:lysophospholipase L1-like esterase
VDAVFVSLGANDFVAGELPSEFVPAYVSLLEQIRLQHPDALIACIWPQLPDPSETAIARSAIDAAIAERTAAGDTQVTGADLELDELVDLACDNYHPGPQTHALMADKTIQFLSAELSW